MIHDEETDRLLKSYLPKIARSIKPEDLEPHPTELTKEELALERTVGDSLARMQTRIQRREHTPEV